MTTLNTSLFFSEPNNEDILFRTPNFCAAFLHILLICGSNVTHYYLLRLMFSPRSCLVTLFRRTFLTLSIVLPIKYKVLLPA